MRGPAAKERKAMMAIAGGMLAGLLAAQLARLDDPPLVLPMEAGRAPIPVSEVAKAVDGGLSAEAVAQCADTVAQATREGLITQRPSRDRIAVDEERWGMMRATDQGRLLRAIACDAWQAATPPPGEQAIAYGRTSGRELAVLRGMRKPG